MTARDPTRDALEEDSRELRQAAGDDRGPFVLCDDGSFCSDPECWKLGCALSAELTSRS